MPSVKSLTRAESQENTLLKTTKSKGEFCNPFEQTQPFNLQQTNLLNTQPVNFSHLNGQRNQLINFYPDVNPANEELK